MLNTTAAALFSVASVARRLVSAVRVSRLYRDEATTERSLQRGDHLRVARSRMGGLFRYTHHGIYMGNGQVIHYAGYSTDSNNPQAGGDCIEVVSLQEFADGREVYVRRYQATRQADTDAILARALSRLGEDRYCLFRNNCEHFATWCSIGQARSTQVRVGYTASGTGMTSIGGIATFKNVLLKTSEQLIANGSELLQSLAPLVIG